MIEMRREKRWPADISMEILSLYKQGNEKVENIHQPIDITDISNAGIGFKSKAELPLDYYFNASITLAQGEVLKCVVHIIRRTRPKESIKNCIGLMMSVQNLPEKDQIFSVFRLENA